MKIFIFVSLAVAIADAVSVYDVVMDEWRFYKANTRRSFQSSEEEHLSLKTFLESKDLVAKHNERYLRNMEHYRLKVNHLADKDLFDSENVKSRFMEESEEALVRSDVDILKIPINATVPDHVDWVALGAVTPPKNQGNCGSCYAVTSAGAMEAYVYIASKKKSDLSIQQIVDCSREFGNDGCDGGTFSNTFRYLKTTGLASADEYPYEYSVGVCRTKGKVLGVPVKKFFNLSGKSEDDLKYIVATYGPVAIGINARPRTFQLYDQGVYTDPSCTPTLVHAVLLVGYGTDTETKKDYWIIKNSWGSKWGENGFMRMERNVKLCGIGKLAYFPQL